MSPSVFFVLRGRGLYHCAAAARERLRPYGRVARIASMPSSRISSAPCGKAVPVSERSSVMTAPETSGVGPAGRICVVASMRPLTNRYLHGAVVGGIGVQLLAASVPAVSRLLGNAAIPVELWAVVFGGALVSWGLAEVATRGIWRHAGRRVDSVLDATPALRG